MLLVNKFSFKLVRFLLTLLVPQIHYFRSIYLDSHRASPRFRHQWENRSWSGTRAFHWEPITISGQTATAVTLQPGASDDLQRNSLLRQPLPASPLAQHLWPQLWSLSEDPALVPAAPRAVLPEAPKVLKQHQAQHLGGSAQDWRHREQLKDLSFQRTTDTRAFHRKG